MMTPSRRPHLGQCDYYWVNGCCGGGNWSIMEVVVFWRNSGNRGSRGGSRIFLRADLFLNKKSSGFHLLSRTDACLNVRRRRRRRSLLLVLMVLRREYRVHYWYTVWRSRLVLVPVLVLVLLWLLLVLPGAWVEPTACAKHMR